MRGSVIRVNAVGKIGASVQLLICVGHRLLILMISFGDPAAEYPELV
jgi:hypothetical protein